MLLESDINEENNTNQFIYQKMKLKGTILNLSLIRDLGMKKILLGVLSSNGSCNAWFEFNRKSDAGLDNEWETKRKGIEA